MSIVAGASVPLMLDIAMRESVPVYSLNGAERSYAESLEAFRFALKSDPGDPIHIRADDETTMDVILAAIADLRRIGARVVKMPGGTEWIVAEGKAFEVVSLWLDVTVRQ